MTKRFVVSVGVFIAIGGIFIFATRPGPSAQQIKPDYSENRTIKDSVNGMAVNFEQCTPDIRRIYVTFGSILIEIMGKMDSHCIMKYGGEMENPNWNGELPFSCSVPQSMGTIVFSKSQYGVDLLPISSYCTK